MTEADLAVLARAAARLPALVVTVAPEAATDGQIARLAAAGAVVSLGHSDCAAATAAAGFAAGARMTTHLFNAMSQLGNREPGLVGAALDAEGVRAGLIADGIHVHPASMRAALAAKRGEEAIFLVTDAMAVAGTEAQSFALKGRTIHRRDGRLTLSDGTLAGADIDFPGAIRVLVGEGVATLPRALAHGDGGSGGGDRADRPRPAGGRGGGGLRLARRGPGARGRLARRRRGRAGRVRSVAGRHAEPGVAGVLVLQHPLVEPELAATWRGAGTISGVAPSSTRAIHAEEAGAEVGDDGVEGLHADEVDHLPRVGVEVVEAGLAIGRRGGARRGRSRRSRRTSSGGCAARGRSRSR